MSIKSTDNGYTGICEVLQCGWVGGRKTHLETARIDLLVHDRRTHAPLAPKGWEHDVSRNVLPLKVGLPENYTGSKEWHLGTELAVNTKNPQMGYVVLVHNDHNAFFPIIRAIIEREMVPVAETVENIEHLLVPTPATVESDLRAWWETTSEQDLEETVPKAVEYGSQSMIDYGRTLARVAGRKVTDAEALEWAIFAYMAGKLGRWTAALQRGEKVSDDTLKDLTIYSLMARKVRETGEWT
jgi:hypothetical protein